MLSRQNDSDESWLVMLISVNFLHLTLLNDHLVIPQLSYRFLKSDLSPHLAL